MGGMHSPPAGGAYASWEVGVSITPDFGAGAEFFESLIKSPFLLSYFAPMLGAIMRGNLTSGQKG